MSSQTQGRRQGSPEPQFFAASSADDLLEEAQKLREEIASFEQGKTQVAEEEGQTKRQALEKLEAKRERYSAVIPILKPDGSTVIERCDFSPRWEEREVSSVLTVESSLPLGIILGQDEQFAGAVRVDEAPDNANAVKAGLRKGDLIRAFTACRTEMTQPTWQLVVGGIGQPKTVRFMYSADNRPFEEVLEAMGSNRMDPEERKVVLVVERRDG